MRQSNRDRLIVSCLKNNVSELGVPEQEFSVARGILFAFVLIMIAVFFLA